jgi:hypothetical protein
VETRPSPEACLSGEVAPQAIVFAGKHVGVGGRDLRRSVISPSLYSRTKESPDRLRTEIRIDQAKSEREGIMRGVFWATGICGGIR